MSSFIFKFSCRFIDDIFLFWNGRETQLLDFIKRLNSRQHLTLNIRNPASNF